MKNKYGQLFILGGVKLTIRGSGFSDQIRVTVGGNDCQIVSSNYSNIDCLAPASVIKL